MIADALRVQIEQQADRVRSTNPLFRAAHAGNFTPDMLTLYLNSVRHLVRHTPLHLRRAQRAAASRGQGDLAAHYASKVAEEIGHDSWATGDISRARERFAAPEPVIVAPAVRALIGFIEETIDRDPSLYLSYILFAEYLVVLMGPEWLGLLEKRCGIPRSMMSIIGNHAELDVDHTQEGLEAIDALVADLAMLAPMRAVLRESMALFDEFSAEVIAHPSARAAVA